MAAASRSIRTRSFPDKSALEVIMTTLHAGGKFDSKVYETSGGLHGVGVSVVNALSDLLEVEVARGQQLYRQTFSRGMPQGPLETLGEVQNRRGTRVRFHPDAQIFGAEAQFSPKRLFKMARSKAYLFGGVEIRWSCAPSLLEGVEGVPAEASFRFPAGLKDYLAREIEGRELVADQIFSGKIEKPGGHGSLEWAIAWLGGVEDGFVHSYCNTIPTPEGGTHEAGLRIALLRGAEGPRRADRPDQARQRDHHRRRDGDLRGRCCRCSSASRSSRARPRTSSPRWRPRASSRPRSATRSTIGWPPPRPRRTSCSTGASTGPRSACAGARRRKSPARPRCASCACRASSPTARRRARRAPRSSSSRATRPAARPSRRATAQTQAVLPLRGKILNVANATPRQAGGQPAARPTSCRRWAAARASHYRDEDLRYEKVIIMTDADVDGAHIASLLITFFYRQMPKLIDNGHLYLAVPPLYRLTPRRQDGLCARRRAQGRAHAHRVQGQDATSRSAASRAWAR